MKNKLCPGGAAHDRLEKTPKMLTVCAPLVVYSTLTAGHTDNY